MTPDEIKKGLECCAVHDCKGCGYNCGASTCIDSLLKDISAFIQQLEDHLREATKKIHQLEAERDALKDEVAGECETCKHNDACQEDGYCMWCDNKESDKTPCCNCIYGCNWEWRGVQKEE